MTFAFLYLFCVCEYGHLGATARVGVSSLFPPWGSRDQRWSGLYLLSIHAKYFDFFEVCFWNDYGRLACMFACALHSCLVSMQVKRGSDLLEWGLEVVMSHHVGSGSFTRTAALGCVVPFLRPSSLKCYKSEGGGWLFKWSLFPVYPFSWFWYFWQLCHFFLKY